MSENQTSTEKDACAPCPSWINGKCTTPNRACPVHIKDAVTTAVTNAGLQAPIPENPVAAVEDELRTSTMRQAKDAIGKLGALLDGPPAGAARALHLIGETAAVYGEMLAAIGVPGVGRKRNRSLVGNYIAGAGDALTLGDSIDQMETSPGGETYGNQALSQFNAGMKQIAELVAGRKDKPSKPKGPTAFDIESLTRAYANAKREAVDPEIVAKLKSRLEEALAAEDFGPAGSVEDGDLVPGLPVDLTTLQAVATGIAAGTGLPVADEEAGALGAAPEEAT